MPCETCPSRWAIKTRVDGSGNRDAKYIIVGEAPGAGEVGSKVPFTGMSGKLLWSKLELIGLKRDDFFVTNSVKCLVDSPKKDTTDACRGFLVEDIESCPNREIIVALGATALKTLVPSERKGIMESSGKMYWSDEFHCWVLACVHPALILRSPNVSGLFKASLDRLVRGPFGKPDPEVVRVERIEQLDHLRERDIVLDLETTGLDYHDPNFQITDIGLCDGEKVYLVPPNWVYDLSFQQFLSDIRLICHNGSFDIKCLRVMTDHWYEVENDTMLMGYVQNESFGSGEDVGYGLEKLAVIHLGVQPWKKIAKQKGYANLSAEEMDVYLGKDVWYTWCLYDLWKEKLNEAYRNVLIPLFNAKSRVEFGGIRFDVELCRRYGERFDRVITHLRDRLRSILGLPDYNPNSEPQNKSAFRAILGYEVRTTDKEVVNANLDKKFFLVTRAYRKLSKLRSVYVNEKNVNVGTGHVHTNYRVQGTETGRISSAGPNVQNIPRFARRLYIPDKDHRYYIQADYDQLELKVIVALAGLDHIIKMMAEGYDLHTVTAMLIYGKDKVSSDERKKAKTVNFGLLYGAGLAKLSSAIGCTIGEATGFKDRFFGEYTEQYTLWKRAIEDKGLVERKVETLFGSVRRFDPVTKFNVEEIKRMIFNTRIQGTAAQMAEQRFTELVYQLPLFYPARIVNTVHDSIDASSGGGGVERKVADYMKDVLERPFWFSTMKFTATVKVAERWM